jgi:hypothetical protein
MRRARRVLLAGGVLIGWALASALVGTAQATELRPTAGLKPPPGYGPPNDEYDLPPWGGLSVGLDVLVDGRPLRAVRHAGRTYLPVPRWGTEYEIRVWNHGPRRIAALVSVDGLSVITGRPASEDQPGYVVAPRSHVLIKGWRRDLSTVAAFTFEQGEDSYASRRGHPENVGVIGLLAIEEKVWRPRPLPGRQDAAAPEARRGKGEMGGTGTGYGRDTDSRAYRVPFVRGGNRRTLTFYYDTADALRRAGVLGGAPFPAPFPADPEFAPAPPKR